MRIDINLSKCERGKFEDFVFPMIMDKPNLGSQTVTTLNVIDTLKQLRNVNECASMQHEPQLHL